MKTLKIYLIVVSVMLVIALGFGVYVWFQLQMLQSSVSEEEPSNMVLEEPVHGEGTPEPLRTEESPSAPEVSETDVPANAHNTVTEPIIIDGNVLTDGQKSVLQALGFQTDRIVITPQVASCAENALGSARLDEITNGATPGPLEIAKLLSCLQ